MAEAMLEGSAGPIKAAYETLRAWHDAYGHRVSRSSLDSFLDFQGSMANRVKAAVTGPPVTRLRELLALMDAGLVRIPFGPSPIVEPDAEGGFSIRSTRLDQPFVLKVDHLVRGHLSEPTIERTQSTLLRHLVERGRIQPGRYGAVPVGSIDLTTDCHPIDGVIPCRTGFGSSGP